MSNKNEFREYYQTISDRDLIDLLEKPGALQPAALEAAQEELSSRALTVTEIDTIRDELNELRNNAVKKPRNEKLVIITTHVENASTEIIETLGPIRERELTITRTIQSLVIAQILWHLFQLESNWYLVKYAVLDFLHMPAYSSFILITLVLLIAALVLFWKRKRLGWNILCIYCVYQVSLTLLVVWSWLQTLIEYGADYFFRTFYPTGILFSSVLFGGSLYILAREDIRTIYRISRQHLFSMIVLFSVVSMLIVLIIEQY